MTADEARDLELVIARDGQRYQILLEIWRRGNGDTEAHFDVLSIARAVNIEPTDAQLAFQFLLGEGLLQRKPNLALQNSAALTHAAVLEIEASIKNPHQPTPHFTRQVVQHFHGPVGASVTGPDSHAHVIQLGASSGDE